MWEKIGIFIKGNWLNLSLVFVGALAFVVYILQERRKVSEAASLIILQVEALQKRISEIDSFIVNGQLNFGAFYESQSLFKTDYWNAYKHYFIKKMDAFSFNTFDEFYNCASEILEQQQLMKKLQKNDFFLTQQTLMQMESNTFLQSLSIVEQNLVNTMPLIEAIGNTVPDNMPPEQKEALENMMKQIISSNVHTNMTVVWDIYGKRRNDIHSMIDQKALTPYIPVQIKITLENALKKYHSIPIIGCEGYRKLKKIGKRKF